MSSPSEEFPAVAEIDSDPVESPVCVAKVEFDWSLYRAPPADVEVGRVLRHASAGTVHVAETIDDRFCRVSYPHCSQTYLAAISQLYVWPEMT